MNPEPRSVSLPPVASEPAIQLSADTFSQVEDDWDLIKVWIRRLDQVAAGFLLLLAMLFALTTAHNGDLWLHLATGRALVTGSYHFGIDPFSFTTADRYWVNHNWLLDAGSYLLYRALGGSALIITKVVVALLLGVLLLCLGAVRRIGWPAIVGGLLALLAISPRLSALQPAIVSYVLLAALWYFVERPLRRAADGATEAKFADFWPVLAIMALWANLDGWFLLGLLVVALTAAGEWVQRWRDNGKFAWSPLGYVLLGSAVVCLLNPHHVRVFSWPAELRVLWESPSYPFEVLDLSPLQQRYYHTTLAQSVGGVTWMILAGLSGVSFLLRGVDRARWRHFLIWVAFLVLALVQIRAVPFFAVVAGPILAINLQLFAQRHWSAGATADTLLRAAFSLRVMTLLVLLILPPLAWAGWLQPKPYERRDWTVEVDSSLQRAAETWHSWRASGQIGAADRVWNSSPDVANYLAWFGQGEESFLDSRYSLFDPTVRSDYQLLHAALATPFPDELAVQVLQNRQIHFLIVQNDPTRALDLHLLARREPENWSIVFQDGSSTIARYAAGNASPGSGPPPLLPVWEPNQRAFHPSLARTAPREWSGQVPRLPDWKDPFVTAASPPNPDRQEALVMDGCFTASRPRQIQRFQIVWKSSMVAALTAPSGVGANGMALCSDTALRLALLNPQLGAPTATPDRAARTLTSVWANAQFSILDEASPSWLYLAIRAARRAVYEQPNDAFAWQALGNAYFDLIQHTTEHNETASWPALKQLRFRQIIAAWQQALQLNPDLDSTRLDLANLYHGMNQPELALPFYRQSLSRMRQIGAGPTETPEQFEQRIKGMESNLKLLEATVSRQRDLYEANSANLKIEDRAMLAMSHGLAQLALDTMLKAEPSSFGPAGLNLEMELLLLTGRVSDVREWLTDNYMNQLTEFDFRWIRARMYAAMGDYDRADEALQRMAEVTIARGASDLVHLRMQMAFNVGNIILEGCDQYPNPLSLVQSLINRMDSLRVVKEDTQLLSKFAELQVLRGLLALECGKISQARACFQTSLEMWGSPDAEQAGAGISFHGRRMAQYALQLIETAGR